MQPMKPFIDQAGQVSEEQLALLATLQNVPLPPELCSRIRAIIARYHAERATQEANRVADEKGWTDEDWDRMLHTHRRTPYNTP